MSRVGLPTEAVCRVVPQSELALIDISTGCRAVIEHRICQQLKGELHLAALARQQRHRSSESTSSAYSAHRDASGIDVRLTGEPGQSVVAVVQGDRKAML